MVDREKEVQELDGIRKRNNAGLALLVRTAA